MGLLRTIVTVLPAILVTGLGLLAIAATMRTLEQLPQALALSVLLVGVVLALVVAMRPWGLRAALLWLSQRPFGKVPRYRQLQVAALAVACGVSGLERLPAFVVAEIPQAQARWAQTAAEDGPVGATVITLVFYLLIAGVFAFLYLFVAVTVLDAMSVGRPGRSLSATMALLWTTLSTGVLVAAEVPRLLGQDTGGPTDAGWWLALAFVLGIARNAWATLLVLGYDRHGFEEALASAVLPARTARRFTALGLVLVVLAHLALERQVGFIASAALVVMGSGPLAYLLEQATAMSAPPTGRPGSPAT